MRNVRTRHYRALAEKLPERILEAARAAFETFKQDPYAAVLANHELADTKKGRHKKGSRAVSVTRRYRAIYVVDGDVNVWYWIGSHEDYNNFVGKV